MDKKALRRQISALKRELTEELICFASHKLTRQFLAHPLYLQAKSIYAYLSYNQEVRTEMLISAALEDGKRVAVPKVFGEEMRFLWIDEDSPIAVGYKGIPEPVEGEIADDPDALVLMPGLAFDPFGRRMGYGGGFYDRFLAKEPHPTIALCYDFQLLDALPTEEHDIPVDAVLTVPLKEEES